MRPGGFSLIEILVVITILGVLASVVTLSFGGDNPGRRVEEEARRLTLVLELARDEAQLRGEEWGFDHDNQSWGFMRFDVGQRRWVDVAEKPFDRRATDGVRLFAAGERRSVATLRADDGTRSLRGAPMPEVVLFSSGEMTRFALEITDEDQRAVWRVDSDGLQPVQRQQLAAPGTP